MEARSESTEPHMIFSNPKGRGCLSLHILSLLVYFHILFFPSLIIIASICVLQLQSLVASDVIKPLPRRELVSFQNAMVSSSYSFIGVSSEITISIWTLEVLYVSGFAMNFLQISGGFVNCWFLNCVTSVLPYHHVSRTNIFSIIYECVCWPQVAASQS